MSDGPVQAFTVTGNDFSTGDGVSPTIRAGADRQNTTPMIVQCINGTIAGTLDANYGKGTGERNGVERDIVVQSVWEYDGYNQRLDDSGIARTLRIGRDSSDFVAYEEPRLFEPMSLREENWIGREVKNALRAEASRSSHAVVGRKAWPLTERGRANGSQMEFGVQGIYNTLAAGNGSSSRRQLTLISEEENEMTDSTHLVVRRLTPQECELLMGWDENWTAEGMDEEGNIVKMADTHRYRMCGNGVVANVGEWFALRYIAALSDGDDDQ